MARGCGHCWELRLRKRRRLAIGGEFDAAQPPRGPKRAIQFEVNLERHPRSVTQSFGSTRLAWQRRNSCWSCLPDQRRRRAGGDAAKLGREAVLLVRAFGPPSGTITVA